MKDELFEELLEGVREGGAILRGEVAPSRITSVKPSSIKALRAKWHLSQNDFATLIGVSVDTLQNWEQDRRRPSSAGLALLRRVASSGPAIAAKANTRLIARRTTSRGHASRPAARRSSKK